MTHQVSMVPGVKLYEIEDRVFAHIQSAIELTKGRYSRDSYCRDIEEGRSQLWIAFDEETLIIDGVIITQITLYPHKRMITYVMVGGTKMSEWHTPMVDLINKYAKDMDCDGAEGLGRRGWTKFLKDNHGWQEGFSFCETFYEAEETRNVA